ncbi:hypothetical protein [Sicyoidochytrium minutum DNA virus]|nr:hypothetical protein [Sicyoidochytrium minutum DNA virus]
MPPCKLNDLLVILFLDASNS